MKIVYLSLIFLSQAAFAAEGDYVIACGKDRHEGAQKSEVALVDNVESNTAFYLDGDRLDLEDFGTGSDDGAWIITVFGKNGKLDRKFVFLEAKKNVQEYLIEANGKEKKLGAPLPCLFPAE